MLNSLFRRQGANLDKLIAQLARHDLPAERLEQLEQFMRTADDRELYKFNPRCLAEKLELDLNDTLDLLAKAVVEGLFELNWDVHCPRCSGRARTFLSLRDSHSQEYCPNCKIDFEPSLDHEVHVTFTVAETVRKLAEFAPLSDPACPPTAGLELLNVPAFRELFTDQILPPGESLQVKRVALLFTDLRGSTALYARQGDPRAYGLVREHFEVLFEAINRNGGSVVKTIGDAVMASFIRPADLFAAACDIHYDLADLNEQLGLQGEAQLISRLGGHVGPCISVTLNGRLDYFGATVNIASRISHLAQGDDIVLTEAMWDDENIQAQAQACGQLAAFETSLRGFDDCFQLRRIAFDDKRRS